MKTSTIKDKPIAYIGGTFDVLHAGHVNLINKVVMMGFKPMIAVNTDKFVYDTKKVHPVFDEWERLKALEEMYSCASFNLVEQSEQRSLIEMVQPAVIVVGSDWLKPEILPQLGIDEAFLRENNISLLVIPRFKSLSSSLIKERILSV